MRQAAKQPSLEDRIQAIEDRLEIYNLLASHPPSADTANQSYICSIFSEDGVLDLGGTKIASGAQNISELSQRQAHQKALRLAWRISPACLTWNLMATAR